MSSEIDPDIAAYLDFERRYKQWVPPRDTVQLQAYEAAIDGEQAIWARRKSSALMAPVERAVRSVADVLENGMLSPYSIARLEEALFLYRLGNDPDITPAAYDYAANYVYEFGIEKRDKRFQADADE